VVGCVDSVVCVVNKTKLYSHCKIK